MSHGVCVARKSVAWIECGLNFACVQCAFVWLKPAYWSQWFFGLGIMIKFMSSDGHFFLRWFQCLLRLNGARSFSFALFHCRCIGRGIMCQFRAFFPFVLINNAHFFDHSSDQKCIAHSFLRQKISPHLALARSPARSHTSHGNLSNWINLLLVAFFGILFSTLSNYSIHIYNRVKRVTAYLPALYSARIHLVRLISLPLSCSVTTFSVSNVRAHARTQQHPCIECIDNDATLQCIMRAQFAHWASERESMRMS